MNQAVHMHPTLAELARITDFLQTEELARYLRCKSQTIFKAHSATGNYLGIRPVKPGNRLLWPISELVRVLTGGGQ